MKKTLIALLCALSLFVTMIAGAPRADAADKSYSVDEARIEIRLNEDGSADITEEWTLSFQSGSFSRFYKDIYTDVTPVEAFSSMTDLSVSIDGTPCEPTNDTSGRPDYHYNRTDGSDAITLSAYLHTGAGSSHTYSLRYTLTDVVKQVEGQYYLFCFRPVPAKFEETVKQLRVTVTAPDGCFLSDRYHTGGVVQFSGSEAEYITSSHRGMFRLRLRMDGGNFGAVPQITAAESRDERSLSELAYSSYKYLPSVETEVWLNPDGSADVMETRRVCYVGGRFSPEKVKIERDAAPRRVIEGVTVGSVTIDGIECEEKDLSADYTYEFQEGGIYNYVRGILNIVNGDSPQHLFNLGSGHGTSIRQVLDTICRELEVEPEIIWQEARPVDVPVNYLDISRYEAAYGSLDPIPLESGIRKTADFLKRCYRLP